LRVQYLASVDGLHVLEFKAFLTTTPGLSKEAAAKAMQAEVTAITNRESRNPSE
jgi:hypothetical protein